MSRITKTIAESVARELTKPKLNELEDLKVSLKEMVTNAVKNTIPFEIMELFKKYPSYFQTHTNSRIVCSGFGYEFYKFDTLPNDRGQDPKIGTQIGNKILSLSQKVEEKRLEYKQLFEEIEIALAGLRTYNNVIKEFPEAVKYLPQQTSTSLTVDLKSIRCKLDKKNCK